MTLLSDPRISDARLADAPAACRLGAGAGPSDADLLAAVRAGDASAYAILYEVHEAAVRRLARRLCRDRHEADDVVSDVFANTLRAIQRGGGPRDEFGLYALRAVRNTVTKLRTRTDTARATPSEPELLDRPDHDDPYRLTGDVERAFADLPERFRDVLWTTAVEGHTPTDLAGAGLDPGAVASLSQRARRALGRSYLRVRTDRPAATPDCRRVRGYLPGYVQHTAGAGTALRIEQHLAHCADCAQIRDEMRDLNGKLRSIPWLALFAAAVRRIAMTVAGAGVPAAATAAAPIVALAVAGSLITAEPQPSAAAPTELAAAAFAAADPLAPPTEPPPAPGRIVRGSATVTANTTATAEMPIEPAVTPSATPLVAPGTPHDGTAITGITGVTDTTGGGAPPAGEAAVEPALTGVLDGLGVDDESVVGTVTGAATGSLAPSVTAGVGTLVDDLGNTIGDTTGLVGALPGGVPAVLDQTGTLLTGVGDTLSNTVSTVDTVALATTDTLAATVAAAGAAAGQATTDLTAVLTPDPADPVGGAVDAIGTTVGNLVDNVVGPTPTTPPACTPLLCLLGD